MFDQFQKIYGEFELMSIPEQKLNTQQWQSIEQRMQTEEAACVLTGAEAEENGWENVMIFIAGSVLMFSILPPNNRKSSFTNIPSSF